MFHLFGVRKSDKLDVVGRSEIRYASNPQPPSKNEIELKEKEATQKKRLKEVKIATRRHKIPLPHNAT